MMRALITGFGLSLTLACSALAQTISPAPLPTPVSVANGGTACSAASPTCVDNIAGGTHTGSGNAVFATSPALTTPTITGAVNTSSLLSTGYSLTGSGANSLIDLSGTLNTSGSPDVFAMRITDTARGGSTTLMNLYGGSAGTTSEFSISRTGSIVAGGNLTLTAGAIVLGNALTVHWGSAGSLYSASLGNVQVSVGPNGAPAADTLAVGDSSRGGTDSNIGGANGTITSGLGTGTGTASELILSSPKLGTTGSVQQTAFPRAVYGGAVPSLSGTCTTGSQVGHQTAGSFTATCTAQTVIITFNQTAENGWICAAQDQSTSADLMKQTANSATTCTLTGTTVASDVIVFTAAPY